MIINNEVFDLMTLFIAICDDEIKVGTDLENKLIKIFEKLKINYVIDVYFTTASLHKKMSHNSTRYDLIFLDIEFAADKINGIEMGQLIRDNHETQMATIIYISWHMKYAMQLFDIRPFNFLIKPLQEEKIETVLKTYLQLDQLGKSEFTYQINRDTFKTPIKEIVYLENSANQVIIHFADGRKEMFYGVLKNVYIEQLEKFDFIYIHAKYVVNYDHVSLFTYEALTLTTGTILPISQPKRKEVRKIYSAIMRKRRG